MTRITRAEDLIPTTPPAFGQETAQVVLDIVSIFPDQHRQSTWGIILTEHDPSGEGYVCKSAACTAGWTWTVHRQSFTEMTTMRPFLPGHPMPGFHFAAKALGIDEWDAAELFASSLRSSEAREALSYLAKGERIDWDQIYYGRSYLAAQPRIGWRHG